MKNFIFTVLGWAGVALAIYFLVSVSRHYYKLNEYYKESHVIDLFPGEKLVNAAWQDSSLWLLTRKARDGESPESYVFREVSRMGWLQGVVTIQER